MAGKAEEQEDRAIVVAVSCPKDFAAAGFFIAKYVKCGISDYRYMVANLVAVGVGEANMAQYLRACGGLLIIALAGYIKPANAEMAFAGAGSNQCSTINSNAVPGRGSGQNLVTQNVFSWVQGYMSGFNGYSLLINRGSPFDLEAASPEAQWEYIVSYCRSHPAELIVKAVQEVQLKLLK